MNLRAKGTYDRVYHTYDKNCTTTRHRSRTPRQGMTAYGDSATKRVIPRVTRYTIVATARTGINIFLSCFQGPVRKNELQILSKLPSEK